MCLQGMRKDAGEGGPLAVLVLLGLLAVQLHARGKDVFGAPG